MEKDNFFPAAFDIARLRRGRRKRDSSYDRTGGNNDAFRISPGETITLTEVDGAGCITHLWFTVSHLDYYWPTRLVLRCYWDGVENPSLEVPLGDFFGVGHGVIANYTSLMLDIVTNLEEHPNQGALNCFFPMPFSSGARITITNESPLKCLSFYSYVDYELYDSIPDEMGRFHAHYRQERPADGCDGTQLSVPELIETPNLDGNGNYVILDVRGRGHYAGCTLNIDNWDLSIPTYWFGEGDDMIFIDGETWPPSLHGTGTEDYFCAAWGFPTGQHSTPFHGVSYKDPLAHTYSGKWSMYRHHILDPVTFQNSIRVTIEHGHANVSNADYSSVAYFYLEGVSEKPCPSLPESARRLPRFLKAHQESAYRRILFVFTEMQRVEEEARKRNQNFDIFQRMEPDVLDTVFTINRLYHQNQWMDAAQKADRLLQHISRIEKNLQ